MKKQCLLASISLLSLLGITSCQNEKTESLDNYEITQVGVRKNEIMEYASDPFSMDTVDKSKLVADADAITGNAILFKGNNYFSRKETLLFADKYSYRVFLDEEAHVCKGTNYYSYNNVIKGQWILSLNEKDRDKYTGTYVFVSRGDLTEYTVKPKDKQKEEFTVLVGTEKSGILELMKLD